MGAKIITVTGYKGGTGKSTTAVHLAAFFVEYGKTILVDGDQNRTAINWAKRGVLPFDVVDERRGMRAATGKDFIIIDTPARPESNDLKELAAGADLLILPTAPDVVSLEPMLETARALGSKAHYRALITIVPPFPSREGETMRDDLKGNGVPVFESMIRRTAGFPKAALAGTTIKDIEDYRARVAWDDYEALGREILELI